MRLIAILAAVVAVAAVLHQSSGQNADLPPKRVPWTTSKIHGTPEPPHPYKAERVFPKLAFNEPIYMVHAPGLDRWFVGEHYGKIYSFPKDQAAAKPDLAIDLMADVKSWPADGNVKRINEHLALVFHPQFAKNRFCYICYVLESKKPGEDLPDGSRVSRFTVTDTDPPKIDAKSEKVIITWRGGGHNGCDLHFGNDGMLYISTGDGSNPNPPDRLNTGQDCSDLLSSILRIDVDKTDPGLEYAIPKDNPFGGLKNVRPEIYAFGFRNPWRMSFDRKTGDLWVGDVGWELWELVDRVQRGGNYGWPIKEGNQDIRPGDKPGPTPPLPPTLAFPHTEAASITGGFVYRGKKFPELEGAYICGDWVTRKIWATKFDGDRIVWHKEIAQANTRIVAFGEDTDGELYIVDHNNPGGIYTLVPNPAAKGWTSTFPRKLSETGLFASTKDHKLSAGVQPFGVRVPMWMDHATAERFVALPGLGKVKMYDQPIPIPETFFSGVLIAPKDAVFGKTISMEMKRGDAASKKKLETQLLHYDGSQWRGYTYVWNDAQTDAELLDAKGKDIVLEPLDDKAPGGKRRQTWHFASRTECMTCHNPWAGFNLAFTAEQLEGLKDGTDRETLVSLGFIDAVRRQGNSDVAIEVAKLPKFPARMDTKVENEARAYLHVNCSHCHQFGAGGSADIELRYSRTLKETKLSGIAPKQGAFGIPDAKLLAIRRPSESVLYYRLAKSGHGHMPHLGSTLIDEDGLTLVRKWIEGYVAFDDDRESNGAEMTKFLKTQTAGEWSKVYRADRAKIIGKLLERPDLAIELMHLAQDSGSDVRAEIAGIAIVHPNPLVRDLFERFATPDQRIERLGSAIDPDKLMKLPGDAARGREVFFSAGFQCANCHKVQGRGGQLGPDLSDVAKRLSKSQIIESLLAPSKTIDAKYLTHIVETAAGQTHTGLLVESNDREMILRVVGDKEVRIPRGDIVATQSLRTSLMPDNLLRDATARQAGDLLEFLWTLR
jgi:putative heme-binding domain-containing protein